MSDPVVMSGRDVELFGPPLTLLISLLDAKPNREQTSKMECIYFTLFRLGDNEFTLMSIKPLDHFKLLNR